MFPYNILNSDPVNTTPRYGAIWPAPKVSYGGLLDVVFVEGSSAPVESINLAEAKAWMKVDVSDDDSVITELITMAREICETYLNISLIPRSVIAIIDNSNGNTYLPYGPVGSITSITDVNGNVISVDNYRLQMEQFKRLAWPCFSYIRLQYTAGYTTLPVKIKIGLMQQILYMYQHRGDEIYISRTGSIDVGLAPDAESTLRPFSRNV